MTNELTDRQLDGFACVRCGSERHAQVPVGFGPRGQLFECSRHHRVVTVERQGGYAARCTVVVDGVEHQCGCTFGGIATRSEARAALVHEDAHGAAGTAAVGEDQNTNAQEGEPAVSSIPDLVSSVEVSVLGRTEGADQ